MGARTTAGYGGWRPRARYSARPFILTLGVIAALAVFSWMKHGRAQEAVLPGTAALLKRGVLVQDQECRLVHHAIDKCAFVKANCPDEEAGILSYLTLYYCRLPNAKPVAFVILVLWLALLFSTIGIAASDFFCVNLSTIANALGMSESMAGVTFLALGNGSPDVFSTFAAMSTNSASLAIGELIGAAGFITAVVAGSMALVRPFKVARKSFVRDVGFFIVAASFSMFFIADGKLSLWESAVMVGFYVFYVCFVMVWHWWLGRRKARRRRTATMRSHYVMPGGEEEEPPQEYHDEDDGLVNEGSRTPTGQVSEADFSALERAGGEVSIEEDDNEEARKRWLGELSSNMRLSRPSVGSRRNTHTPIRPSLVGALEFRAVLTSLQSSRNIQSIPIGLRRYSDDPTFTSAQQQGLISTTSDPAPRPPYDVVQEGSNLLGVSRPTADIMKHNGNRTRAVSTNDMDNTQLDPRTLLHGTVPSINFGPASPEEGRAPSPSGHASRTGSSAVQSVRQPSPDRLALPQTDGPGSRSGTTNPSALSSPTIGPTQDTPRPSPKFADPGATTPPIPFPPYSDFSFSIHSLSPRPSLNLPSPSALPESMLHQDHFLIPSDPITVPRWWPSKFLPPPHILTSTLFPTLSNWRDKGIWEKLLGVVAAPSVFLLTMTLPVVENQKEDNDDDDIISPSISLPGPLTPLNGSLNLHQRSLIPSLDAGSFPSMNRSVSKDGNSKPRTITTPSGLPPPLISITSDSHILQSPEQLPTKVSSPEPKEWNRWLFIVQTFTAPFFIVLIVWANTEVAHPRALVRPTLYSLTFSLVLLAIILVTTTPSHPPRWRTLLCYLGFAVSIAWISSIANEVVGVLKTLGVVLDMSDAILGLTIFAVGNSLGDFVADITVARLGFPVMALSACFGGPMLNILLGIGISGCYLTIKGGQHRHEKHPDNPVRFKPYHIDISTTLVISGATLLATLVGLLVAVPLRKWKMDRTIGWGLVALWSASTLANVIVEVLGLSSNVS